VDKQKIMAPVMDLMP